MKKILTVVAFSLFFCSLGGCKNLDPLNPLESNGDEENQSSVSVTPTPTPAPVPEEVLDASLGVKNLYHGLLFQSEIRVGNDMRDWTWDNTSVLAVRGGNVFLGRVAGNNQKLKKTLYLVSFPKMERKVLGEYHSAVFSSSGKWVLVERVDGMFLVNVTTGNNLQLLAATISGQNTTTFGGTEFEPNTVLDDGTSVLYKGPTWGVTGGTPSEWQIFSPMGSKLPIPKKLEEYYSQSGMHIDQKSVRTIAPIDRSRFFVSIDEGYQDTAYSSPGMATHYVGIKEIGVLDLDTGAFNVVESVPYDFNSYPGSGMAPQPSTDIWATEGILFSRYQPYNPTGQTTSTFRMADLRKGVSGFQKVIEPLDFWITGRRGAGEWFLSTNHAKPKVWNVVTGEIVDLPIIQIVNGRLENGYYLNVLENRIVLRTIRNGSGDWVIGYQSF